jgi:hypothetical protein
MDDLPKDRQPQRVSGTLRIPAQWGKYKGSVRENLAEPSRIKSFSEYISDK